MNARVAAAVARLPVRAWAGVAPARAAGAIALLVALCAFAPYALAPGAGLACAASAALCVLGYRALGPLRFALAGPNPAQLMALLGAAGMGLGLMIDARGAGLDALLSACRSAPGYLELVRLHWAWLPATHLGMVAAGLLALPLARAVRAQDAQPARQARNLVCLVWMLAGMTLANLFVHAYAVRSGGAVGAAAMLGAMLAGMVWGMAAGAAMQRALPRRSARSGTGAARF